MSKCIIEKEKCGDRDRCACPRADHTDCAPDHRSYRGTQWLTCMQQLRFDLSTLNINEIVTKRT